MANLSPENRALLEQAIAQHGLEAVALDIIAQAMESVALEVTEPEQYTRTGNSRYGGVPDLPPEIAWPRTEDRLFLNFFMQINLGEMPSVVGNSLPDRGMLYFFLESDEPATNNTCQILYYDGDLSTLTRAEAPTEDEVAIGDYWEMRPHRLLGHREISLPGYYTPLRNTLMERDETVGEERYDALRDALRIDIPSVGGALLGHPSCLNGDPRQNAVLVRSGNEDRIYDYGYHDEHQEELTSGMEEWRLLLTLDSNRKVGITIWDAGFIQVLIHKDDLAKRDFSQVYSEVFSS